MASASLQNYKNESKHFNYNVWKEKYFDQNVLSD